MKRILRISALLLLAVFVGTSAKAAEWNIPEPQPSAMVPGDTFAIRNVGMQMFIYSGEAWGTQATVNSIGQEALAKGQYYLVSPVLENDETFGDAYTLYDNSKGNATDCIWRQPNDSRMGTGIKGCFVDATSEKAFSSRAWVINEVSTNKYTFQVPATCTEANNISADLAYVEGEFLGVQVDHPSTFAADNSEGVTYGLYYDVIYADAPENCQWEFINKKDIDIYAAKVKLAALIDEASELGLDVTAATALVNDPSATLEDLKAAYEELETLMQELDKYNHPAEITDGYIITPNPYQGNSTGWTVTDGDGQPADIGSSSKHGDYWIGEFWNAAGYKMAQTITLPAGVYMLRAIALTRTDMKSTLAAGEAKTILAQATSGEANSRAAAATWFESGNGVNEVTWIQAEEGDVEISITSDDTTGDHWTVWRNFSLFDRGNTVSSYQNAIADFISVEWQSEFTDAIFTEDYYHAVEDAYTAAETAPTTAEEALAQYNAITNALKELRENVSLYKKLQTMVDEEGDVYEKYDGSMMSFDAFAEVWYEAMSIYQDYDYTKTNEYLADLIERYNEAREALLEEINFNPTPGAAVDVLVNPGFKNGTGTQSSFEGWTVNSSSSFQNNAGAVPVIEQWNSASTTGVIDVYQKVYIPHAGAYQLRTKGWYRSTTDKTVHDTTEGYMEVNTYLYAAASKYKFHDIYDHPYTTDEKEIYFPNGNQFEGDGNIYPNNCTGANELFNNEEVTWYDMTADFLAYGDSIKVGVQGDDIPGYGWLIWDDMEVIYLGDDVETMQPIAQYAADDAKQYVDGIMSSEAREALQACINGIENAGSAEELLNAYKNIGDAVDNARASVKLYQRLINANEQLSDLILEYGESASEEALTAAENLMVEMESAIDAGSIKDEDVEAAIQRIIEAGNALKMPKDVMSATDDDPKDLTGLIKNPTYFDNYNIAVTSEGWTDPDGNFSAQGTPIQGINDEIGFAEGWNTSFDFYQDITGLPEGTYRVVVSGLYRQVSTTAHAKTFQYGYAEKLGVLDMLNEDAKTEVMEIVERAKVYANGDSVAFTPWIFIEDNDNFREAFSLGADGGYYEYQDSLTTPETVNYYYYPNDRTAAYSRVQQGFYDNEVYCYVADDGKLRIGACNKTAESADWVPFTNWRLYYLGQESSHESTTGVRETDLTPAAIEAIYSIDGRRLNSLQKGLNIVIRNGKSTKVLVK
ncbi:MAG: hypothetical protein K6C10_01480 [Prevotella sp.]|nr:hypothetical protein [Prevotella sp.]